MPMPELPCRSPRLIWRIFGAFSSLFVATAATSALLATFGSGRLGETLASPIVHESQVAQTGPTTTVAPPQLPLVQSRTPGIPIVPAQSFDLPDPMLISVAGKYHMFFSSAFLDQYRANVPELIGTGYEWVRSTESLPRLPIWAQSRAAGGNVWDPYVEAVGDSYLMYYSAQVDSRYRDPSVATDLPTHCLGVAIASSPDGPFLPVSNQPLVCQQWAGGDIDVHPVHDPNGPNGPGAPWYLIWKSDGNNLRTASPPAIWAAGLSNDGMALTSSPRVIFQADQPWEKPVIEAPQMVSSPDGRWWLFFSAGTGFYTADYGMGVALCDGPLGPCSTVGRGPLVASNDQGEGPGEETVYVGPDQTYWLLYNPWHTALMPPSRPVEAVRIGWGQSGPYVASPGDFPPPRPYLLNGHLRSLEDQA